MDLGRSSPRRLVPTTRRFVAPDGVELVADHYRSGFDAVVVVSHGIFGRRSLPEIHHLANELAHDFDVVAYDVRGHGESAGRFTFGLREWADLEAIVAQLRRDYACVLGLGFSFGAFHTCVAAARTSCFDAIAMISSPKSFAIVDHNFFGAPFWESLPRMRLRERRRARVAPMPGRRTMPIDCIGDIHVPIHLLHGDRDWLIHHKHAYALHARAPQAELTILRGGLHAEYLVDQMPDVLIPLLRSWFSKVRALPPTAEA